MKENNKSEFDGTILDVRTSEDFSENHLVNATNIPLHEIPSNLDDIKYLSQPIVVFCASGSRSKQAHFYLKEMGIETINRGSWQELSNN
jgi:rhodanese-related sulfurtransferase